MKRKRKVKMRKIKPKLRQIRSSILKAWNEHYKNVMQKRQSYHLEIPAIEDIPELEPSKDTVVINMNEL